MLIYDQGFTPQNIIGQHDRVIKNIIMYQLSEDDVFINTTWLEVDDNLKHIADKNKNAICYSGPDWENTICRKKQNEFIDDNFKDVYRVGNTRGDYYFSFWLDFVFNHLPAYQKFDPYKFKNIKTFMCLNRKPHEHRVELINQINSLKRHGIVSLGGETPILLDIDVKNQEGDNSVGGKVGITNDITGLGHKDNWNAHFLNVVTETTIHSDVFISEKTLKPIIGKRPFIILGDFKLYSILHSWGIDTFDDLFGKGYLKRWHTDRIDWIQNVLESLTKEKKLDSLLNSLKPRLEKNYTALCQAYVENKEKIENLL